MDLTMDPSIDQVVGTVHSTLHIIPDPAIETTATPATMIHTTDRDTTEITTEIGDTNQTIGMTRKTKTIKTGMITIQTGTGSTTDRDQTNTNTTETNPKHKSSLNTQTKTCPKC